MAPTRFPAKPIQIRIGPKEFCPPALCSVQRGDSVSFCRSDERDEVVVTVDKRLFGVNLIDLDSHIQLQTYQVLDNCPLDQCLTFSCPTQPSKGGGGIETMSGTIRVTSG